MQNLILKKCTKKDREERERKKESDLIGYRIKFHITRMHAYKRRLTIKSTALNLAWMMLLRTN